MTTVEKITAAVNQCPVNERDQSCVYSPLLSLREADLKVVLNSMPKKFKEDIDLACRSCAFKKRRRKLLN